MELHARLSNWMLSTYLTLMALQRDLIIKALRPMVKRARRSESGSFFSENFLMLAVFSIPVAVLFFWLARNFIWPYARDNIFPCFQGNGEGCFEGLDENSF